MKKITYLKYYRVYKNGTSVTEVSANDFRPVRANRFKKGWLVNAPVDVLCAIPVQGYTLPADDLMYYGYTSRVEAMEKAKSGAMAYINAMIKGIEQGIATLRQYRNDHYEDLNVNLLDANIRRLQTDMNN